MDEGQSARAERFVGHAEAVRAYLVSVRGGAPMLSSTDARILHDWLLRGVRIGAIVRGIDRTAQKRLAQKVRTPLSLASCRAEVEKQQKQAGAWVRGARPLAERGAEAADPRFAAVDALAATLDAELLALASDDAEARLVSACALAARFFDDAWGAGPRELLFAAAAERLADARSLYDDEEWEEAVEAMARDELRQRYPRFTATWLAREVYGGVE